MGIHIGMDQKRFQILSIIALVIFAAGITWYYTNVLEFGFGATPQEKTKTLVEKGDIGRCAKVRDVVVDGIHYESVCRNNIALSRANETLDISYCDLVDDQLVSKSECRQNVIVNMIKQKKDSKYCDLFSGNEQEFCYTIFTNTKAQENQNIDVCGELEHELLRTQCRDNYSFEAFAKDPSTVVCSSFSDKTLQDECAAVQIIAKTPLKRTGDCQNIFHPMFHKTCKALQVAE